MIISKCVEITKNYLVRKRSSKHSKYNGILPSTLFRKQLHFFSRIKISQYVRNNVSEHRRENEYVLDTEKIFKVIGSNCRLSVKRKYYMNTY